MLFSHISDTHLGLVQYGSNERERDVYDAFNQAIDISISDKVDFVIFSGIFLRTPNQMVMQYYNGKCIKRLKKRH